MASGLTKIYFQVSLGASETLLAKQDFERFALSCGVMVKSYRTDNGIFTKEQFLTEIIDNNQSISCSGVGAHHQNGIAERAIRTHVTKARTILLHAMLRWPEQTSSDLWPMAMQHSEHLVNILPNMSDGFSPEEKFCRTFKTNIHLEHLPVWGCPTYVLDPTLQDGRKIPKWNSRSRRGQFVGWSPLHASNVALVRNLNTGRISPQFHVVFDNWFETVYCDEEEEEPPVWDIIVTHSKFAANVDPLEMVEYEIDDEWLTKEEINDRPAKRQSRIGMAPRDSDAGNTTHVPPETSNIVENTATPIATRYSNQITHNTNTKPTTTTSADTDQPIESMQSPALSNTPTVTETRRRRQSEERGRRASSPREERNGVRRSQQQRQAPQRFGYDGTGVAGYMELVDFIRKRSHANTVSAECMVAYWTMLNTDPRTGQIDDFEPVYTNMAFKAAKRKSGNPDIPNYREAMAGEHREAFKLAMEKELQGLADKGTWHAMLRSAVPKEAKVIPLT